MDCPRILNYTKQRIEVSTAFLLWKSSYVLSHWLVTLMMKSVGFVPSKRREAIFQTHGERAHKTLFFCTKTDLQRMKFFSVVSFPVGKATNFLRNFRCSLLSSSTLDTQVNSLMDVSSAPTLTGKGIQLDAAYKEIAVSFCVCLYLCYTYTLMIRNCDVWRGILFISWLFADALYKLQITK